MMISGADDDFSSAFLSTHCPLGDVAVTLDYYFEDHIDGLVQDCSNSSVLAVQLLQSCTKPSISRIDILSIFHEIAFS